MNTHNILRFFHIVGGILWVGFAVFTAMFLMPTLRALGPAGGAVMREIAGRRKLPIYMMAISWITLLSGAGLMWRDAAGLGHAFFQQGMGLVLGVGALFAIVASVIGMIVSAPTARKLGTITAGLAGRGPTPEEGATMQALQNRLNSASVTVAILLMLAAAAMATARYI